MIFLLENKPFTENSLLINSINFSKSKSISYLLPAKNRVSSQKEIAKSAENLIAFPSLVSIFSPIEYIKAHSKNDEIPLITFKNRLFSQIKLEDLIKEKPKNTDDLESSNRSNHVTFPKKPDQLTKLNEIYDADDDIMTFKSKRIKNNDKKIEKIEINNKIKESKILRSLSYDKIIEEAEYKLKLE